MNVEELIERSHAMAVEKCWWPDGPEGRSVTEQVNNFHAEISEAWEEWRAGRIETWWHRRDDHGIDREQKWDLHYFRPNEMIAGGWKPEGFWIEIADLCIRLADTMGAYGWEWLIQPVAQFASEALLVQYLHCAVSAMNEVNFPRFRIADAPQIARVVIAVCIENARIRGVDLLELCELKMAYNATRPIRHGGKRA